jgi:acetyl-CoA/propionyl-CoA carboxylase biotin carboxyl carrier protein
LSFDTSPALHGHAIECRINAEDPARDFAPTPGTLLEFDPPRGFGVRVDTGFEAGDAIDPRFDNLIAKLVVRGRDRAEVLSRLDRALADFEISGVATTIPLYRRLLRRPDFQSGDYDTRYIERSGVAATLEPYRTPEDEPDEAGVVSVEVNGRVYRVRLPETFTVGAPRSVPVAPGRAPAGVSANPGGAGGNELKSPIQGTVLSVAVEVGDAVAAGDLVCVVEAMKMENELVAPRSGTIARLPFAAGATVRPGDVLAVIE